MHNLIHFPRTKTPMRIILNYCPYKLVHEATFRNENFKRRNFFYNKSYSIDSIDCCSKILVLNINQKIYCMAKQSYFRINYIIRITIDAHDHNLDTLISHTQVGRQMLS